MERVIVLWTLLFLFLEGAGIRAEGPPTDWPHLRGPTYDAVSSEKGLVDSWPETGPPVLWTRELGQGYSGFIAVGSRVYTMFQSAAGQYVVSLEADTGAEIWRQRVDWAWDPAGRYPGPYATPTWHAGRIYYSTPTGLVGCLDANDGGLIWSVEVRKRFKGKGTEFGYAATPLIESGRVIVPVGGPGASVVALDARDGAISWAVGDDPASYCPAYPITLRGRRLVVVFLRNWLALHDPVTGKQVARQELSTDYDEHSAWPLYAEPHLLVASPFRVGAQLSRLDENRELKLRTVWANTELSNDVASSVLVEGHVYGFDLHQLQASAHRPSRGRFKCLDFATGKVRWETDKVGQATVLVADGKLILLNDTGTLILARVNPTAYQELARTRVLDAGVCWTPPTLWNGRLFVRNQSRAACLYLGRPERLDPRQPTETVAAEQPRQLRFDWSRLVTHEPEYPHDAPSSSAVGLWFGWCVVGVFGGAGVLAGLVGLLAWAAGWARPARWAGVTFATTAFLLGMAGTTILGVWIDAFILTWPASLYLGFWLTLTMVVWSERQDVKTRPRWRSWAIALLFIALCYGYYSLCLAVDYTMAWGFLGGFMPAVPIALVAARARKWWLRLVAGAAAFTVYFWVSGLLPGWKSRWFG
jgi:outer membrane protein assembly factor BamB